MDFALSRITPPVFLGKILFKLNENNAMYVFTGIKHTARINEPILSVVAVDGDLEENGTLTYMVAASNLYKFGASVSSGSIVPSPFNITQEGEKQDVFFSVLCVS